MPDTGLAAEAPKILTGRRTFLGGLAACGALALAGPARALPRLGRRQIAFDIRREGASIGRHEVRFRQSGDDLEVDIEIDIVVNFAFIPVFRYRHRNHEVWRQGRLVALDSETDDDGRTHAVSARQRAAGLWVSGSEGQFLAPPDVLPTSYWNPETVKRTRLLDSQHGRMLDVRPDLLGEEPLADGPASRYRLSGDLSLDLWYAKGEWVKIAFQARGAEVSYARRDAPLDGGASG